MLLATALQMALDEVMLSQDKLYVVLAVVLIIWAGLIKYLFALDRKLGRLESAMAESESSASEQPASLAIP